MQRFIRFVLVGFMALAAGAYAQQPGKEQQLPNDLVQYIRDARAAGTDEKQIQQNAVNAGWPPDVVGRAIESLLHPQSGMSASPSIAVMAAKTGEQAPQAAPSPAGKTGGIPPANAAQAAAPPTKAPEAGETPKVPPAVDHGVPDDYHIGAGDELQISVWKEPDASVPGVVVRPDGRISMPILKEVSVVGLTPTEAEKNITEQLVKFISAADVTVIVKAINSKKIYVVGGVKKEGPIPYTYRMTILQALSEAGGLSDYAKRKKIYVLRHENGRDYRLPFDYDAALRGAKMELNIPLQSGDTLVVPK